jgi:hypothetical protein
MQNPVKERITKLREEMPQISEANRLYFAWRPKKIVGAAGDHEPCLQRLQEIPDELAALTDWKKGWGFSNLSRLVNLEQAAHRRRL